MVLSGLAYGVDIIAHREALKQDLPTAAVLAHGLDKVYPAVHRRSALEILEKGGAWISEFLTGTNPDRENFPRRNRIIAGLSDATLVIESGLKGGSMITSSLAFGYSREVFAVPGRVGTTGAEGCHFLIKDQKASLVERGNDILSTMGWSEKTSPVVQQSLFNELSEIEQQVMEVLRFEDLHIDILAFRTQIRMPRLSGLLLELELKGLIKALPGKKFGVMK
jgi:DNA processing protein